MLKQLLLSLKFFLRYRAQKRKARYLQERWNAEKKLRQMAEEETVAVVKELEQKHLQEIKFISEAFENQIYIEKYRGDSIYKEAFDRFLQLLNLNPTFSSPVDAPPSPLVAAKQEQTNKENEQEQEELLLKDEKIRFWADGVKEGKSEQEIEVYWKAMKGDILNDIQLSRFPTDILETEQ